METLLQKSRQTGYLLFLLLLTVSFSWGQGLEDFTNSNATASYTDGSFVGNNGIIWTYVASRDGNADENNSGINLPALMLRRVADDSKVTSSAIPNGIGNFSMKLYKGFTGGGDREVELFVNGTSQGASTPFDDFDEHIFEVNGIDISGDVIIEIRNITSKQIIIDDITWTDFGGGGNTGPFITNITQNPSANNVTSSDAVSVSADLMDSDGIASAELHWGAASGSLTNTISMSFDVGDTYTTVSAIPAQADGTTIYWELEATDANASPETTTSVEYSYTVEDPLPFGIPYSNAFEDQTDYDEALGLGFEFNNANQNGSYVHIISGSIISPSIDFSGYDGLAVSFDLGTYGGSDQELGVSVSDDNGANYTLLGTFIPTSTTPSGFEQIIDLTSLNGTNGRIKFEQTSGANSIRFKNLNIEESQGGNVGPVITNITQNPSAVTSSDAVLVSADIVDLDGIASAELHWGTASGSLTNTIAMSLDAGDTYAGTIPAQADGTTIYYEIEATDANASPETTISAEYSYTVSDPIPFDLPYFNGLRDQDDLDEALGYGFEFNSATLTTSAGGYIRIANGSIISPAIDFSAYNNLTVIFDAATFGGNTDQELTVSISNNNGATYTSLDTFAPASSTYETFSQFIDLSTLTGANGRIKFEMSGGTNSIRFRDLSIIQEFEGYLYSNGNWSPSDPNGVSTATDDLYIINGTATLSADTDVRNITINEGATLRIEKVLNAAGDITNDGDLVFVSTNSANGELGPVSGTVTGIATVQRYMTAQRSYRMVSSAVTTSTSIMENWQEGVHNTGTDYPFDNQDPNPGFGTHITGSTSGANGFDATSTGNSSMFTVDLDDQEFVAIDNTDINTLKAGDGYLLFVRGDRGTDLSNNGTAPSITVLRAKGTLLTGSDPQDYDTVNAGEFAMFGNPYQSAVDMTSVMANASNVNTNLYYVYDPTLATRGGYVTVDLPSGGNNTSGSNANKYLQPGQGAQFATDAAGVSSLVFNESDKAPGNFTPTNSNGDRLMADDMLTFQLYTTENYNNGGTVHDSFGIIFADGNDNGVTSMDARKPMNFDENFGIDHNGTYLSLERRAMPQLGEVYSLYSTGYKNTHYTVKVIVDGLEDSEIYLDDQFTGNSLRLDEAEMTYTFEVDENNPLSIATDRFSINVENRLGVEDNVLLAGIQLYPNPLHGNSFYINAPKLNGEEVTVSINDMLGREIYSAQQSFSGNTLNIDLSQELKSGVYIVTLSSNGESKSFRIIKR